jgi:hypothetical protein
MPTGKARATALLQAALAAGPVPATEVSRRAHAHGLTAKAVRSGREALGVKVERAGFGPGAHSLWSLPRREHMDAQPSSEVSENSRPKTKEGYEIIEPECTYCGKRAGPPGPQSGPVFMVRNPFAGGKFAGTIIPAAEPLHEDCAAFWFDWLRKTGHGKV